MSEPSETQPRPPQVTVAAWMIMVGSVFVVLMVWDRIAALHTLDTREALKPILEAKQVQSTGLTLPELLAIIRVVAMVAAGCATAMVILGYQAMQRSRGARLALTLLAVPLFVAGVFGLAASGGYLASAVAAAVATLWLGHARLWFDGRPIPAAPDAAERTRTPTRPVWPPPYDPDRQGPQDAGLQDAQAPPAPAQPTPVQPAAPPAAWNPPPTNRYGVPVPPPVARTSQTRPPAVVWACVLTWFFTSAAVALLGASIALFARDPDLILTRMHEQNPELAAQGVSDHLIMVISYTTCALLMLWSAAAAGIAVFAFRGNRVARYLLIASAAGAAVFCLLAVLGSLLILVPLGAAAATVGCLLRADVRAWYAASARQGRGPQAP